MQSQIKMRCTTEEQTARVAPKRKRDMSRLDRVKVSVGGTLSMPAIDIELQAYLDLMYGPSDADLSEEEAAPQARDVKDPMEFWSGHSASF